MIALIEDGDKIVIDVNKRMLHLDVDEAELGRRREAQLKRKDPWTPKSRNREVSDALKLYSLTATSASAGAVRDVSLVQRKLH